jgi:hypothetical protein
MPRRSSESSGLMRPRGAKAGEVFFDLGAKVRAPAL